jgi:hypothetical protein
MATRRRESRVGTILDRRTTGLLSWVVFVVLAYLATITPTSATAISYVLNPPITGGGATVVGGFTFNTAGPALDAVALSVTAGPQPGSYTVPVSATSTEIVAEIPSTTDTIVLIFTKPLGNVPDAISAIAFPPTARDPAPATGEAVPSTPEPASLALLGGALGIFLVTCRAIRRTRQARADHPMRVPPSAAPPACMSLSE